MVITTAASSVPATRAESLSVNDSGIDPVVAAAHASSAPVLVDSLLHDVRNPLNALSIHLEVLTEKLKASGDGEVPVGPAKNLKAMREQLQRVDGLLRLFADFLALREGGSGDVSLSDAVARGLEVLGHEGRRGRVQLQPQVEPGVRVRLADAGAASFLVVQAVLRAFRRTQPGGAVGVAVRSEAGKGVLEVTDAGDAAEPSHEALAALGVLCERLGVALTVRGGTCRLDFPRG